MLAARRRCLILLGSALLPFTGCERDPTPGGAGPTTQAPSPAEMQPPPIAEADRTFLIAAAEAGVVDTEASRLAVERGADPAVKAAAERLIAGHAALNDELGHLAALKGVTLPAAPANEEGSKLAGLRGLAGRALDRAYLDQLAASQLAAIERYERAASESPDPELRAFAAKTLPLLREYQALSRRLAADQANA